MTAFSYSRKLSRMLTLAHVGAWRGAIHSSEVWLFTFVLAIAFPVADYLLYFRLKSKLKLYAWNICAEWALVAACVWVIHSKGFRLADLGERLGSPTRTLVVSGLLIAIFAALTLASKKQTRKASVAQLSKAVGRAKRILPLNGTDRAVFVAVALTAGVCEEFLYRGWLLNLIGYALGSVWAGLVLSSIVFGAAHAYQGRSAIIGASVLGIVFGAVFILSGSLLPGQILHAAIDLKNELALGKIASRLDMKPAGTPSLSS
ncbi:MAG: CPBP family intramembrane glutamic endopeptidase [Terriglobia bacterium]